MNVTKPRRTRRTHSEEFKRSLIEACGEPGASVAGVALANGINANQLRRWMRERGIEPPALSCPPLRVAASEPMGGFSYSFRPGRNQHQALVVVGMQKRRVKWVLDADIKAFFDTVNHTLMMRLLEHRI